MNQTGDKPVILPPCPQCSSKSYDIEHTSHISDVTIFTVEDGIFEENETSCIERSANLRQPELELTAHCFCGKSWDFVGKERKSILDELNQK